MILAVIGLIVYVVGAIGLLIDEFKESIWWGLAGLLTQVSHILFAILHFRECKKSLAIMLIGILIMAVGSFLAGA